MGADDGLFPFGEIDRRFFQQLGKLLFFLVFQFGSLEIPCGKKIVGTDHRIGEDRFKSAVPRGRSAKVGVTRELVVDRRFAAGGTNKLLRRHRGRQEPFC